MTGVRYTSEFGKVETLSAPTYEVARRLFRYAVSVATATVTIELMDEGCVRRTHQVE